jgi:hypothetical protein
MQIPASQSLAAAHILRGPHFGHPLAAPPPQSTSVSLPFLRRSAQSAAAQTPALQTKLAQSPPLPHFLPGAQPAQEPPQFRSDSVPFLTASVQDGATHMPPVQTWL